MPYLNNFISFYKSKDLGGIPLVRFFNGDYVGPSTRYIWSSSSQTLFGAFLAEAPAIATIGAKERYQSEGTRTNRIDAIADWTVRGACSASQGFTDPAGGNTAWLIEHLGTVGVNDMLTDIVRDTPDQPLGIGCFVKRVSTTGAWEFRNRNGDKGDWNVDYTKLSDEWERITVDHPAIAVDTDFVNEPDGDASFLLADQGSDSSVMIWFPQLPDEPFLSSPIAEATTRVSDSLSFAAGTVNSTFLEGAWTTEITPEHSSQQVTGSGVHYLYFHDASNNLVLSGSGTDTRLKLATSSGSIERVVGYDREQTFSVSVDFTTDPGISASLTLSGANSGNGTSSGSASFWPSDVTLFAGSDSTPDNHLFGLISEPVAT